MNLYLTLHTKVDPRMRYELHVKDKTIKLIEENERKYIMLWGYDDEHSLSSPQLPSLVRKTGK